MDTPFHAVVGPFHAVVGPFHTVSGPFHTVSGPFHTVSGALGDLVTSPRDALSRLEVEFATSLLIVAGDIQKVAEHAEQLRLAITTEECGVVLDHIGRTHVAEINIDQVEDAINALFPDRFMEP